MSLELEKFFIHLRQREQNGAVNYQFVHYATIARIAERFDPQQQTALFNAVTEIVGNKVRLDWRQLPIPLLLSLFEYTVERNPDILNTEVVYRTDGAFTPVEATAVRNGNTPLLVFKQQPGASVDLGVACSTCGRRTRGATSLSGATVAARAGANHSMICTVCANEFGVLCEVSGLTFDKRRVRMISAIVNGIQYERVCKEWLVAQGMTFTVTTPPTPFAVPSYHGARRPSDWIDRRLDATSYGVELELGFKQRGKRDAMLHEHFSGSGGCSHNQEFVVEQDSSLSDVPFGVEIISSPMPLRAGYQNEGSPWRELLDAIRAAGGEGWKHRDKAGIHVNMNASAIPEDELNKFALFITNAAPLSMRISGRKKIFAGNTRLDETVLAKYKRLRKLVGANSGYWAVGKSLRNEYLDACRSTKYMPVSFRGRGRIEVRIFGSNVATVGFLSCVEYCDAIRAFVKKWEEEALLERGVSIVHDFRTFVSLNRVKWPALATRMQASNFKKEAA